MIRMLLLLPGLFMLSGFNSGQTGFQNSPYPPAGRMVQIGGRRLHMICSGKGSPTVVLVAGAGAFAIDWNLVQNRVDRDTRVCSYDRAGLGWSDPGPAEETVQETVSDLHQLLIASGEKGPYLLVGASIGGILIQAYQYRYPREVAALVFTNSSNQVGFATKSRVGLIWDLSEAQIRSSFPFPPQAVKRTQATRVSEPFDRLPPKLRQVRLWLDERLQEKWDTAVSDSRSILSWRREFLREFDQSDSMKGKYPLGSLPVIVVSSDPKADNSLRYSRAGAAARLDYLSSNSIHIMAPGSGHEIHLYQPDKVVRALRIAILAMRRRIPLSGVSLKD